jgi:hypothetical protein
VLVLVLVLVLAMSVCPQRSTRLGQPPLLLLLLHHWPCGEGHLLVLALLLLLLWRRRIHRLLRVRRGIVRCHPSAQDVELQIGALPGVCPLAHERLVQHGARRSRRESAPNDRGTARAAVAPLSALAQPVAALLYAQAFLVGLVRESNVYKKKPKI